MTTYIRRGGQFCCKFPSVSVRQKLSKYNVVSKSYCKNKKGAFFCPTVYYNAGDNVSDNKWWWWWNWEDMSKSVTVMVSCEVTSTNSISWTWCCAWRIRRLPSRSICKQCESKTFIPWGKFMFSEIVFSTAKKFKQNFTLLLYVYICAKL